MTNAPAPSVTKAALRKELRAKRAAIPRQVRRQAGRQVLRLALGQGWIRRGKRIGFYIPAKGELNILPLLSQALWMGAECFLPVVPPSQGRWHGEKRLWFTPLGEASHPWAVNRYGIPEYVLHRGRRRIRQLDTVFLPMLGFDLQGYRMGMGGGYYDTSLAYLGRRRHWRRPKLIGVAYAAQKIVHLPREPWDIPLNTVVTEQGIYRFRAAP